MFLNWVQIYLLSHLLMFHSNNILIYIRAFYVNFTLLHLVHISELSAQSLSEVWAVLAKSKQKKV